MNKTVIAVNLKSANWISYIQSLSFQVCTFLLNYLGVKSNNEDSFFTFFVSDLWIFSYAAIYWRCYRVLL